jgi:hypothetical protein
MRRVREEGRSGSALPAGCLDGQEIGYQRTNALWMLRALEPELAQFAQAADRALDVLSPPLCEAGLDVALEASRVASEQGPRVGTYQPYLEPALSRMTLHKEHEGRVHPDIR